MRNYGFDGEALKVFSGIYQAATHFDLYRLPELFAGFGQDQYRVPRPLSRCLQSAGVGGGKHPIHAARHARPHAGRLCGPPEISFVPTLPDWLDWVVIRGVQVGNGHVDLRYERSGGTTLVAVLHKKGDLDVMIEY